MSDSAIQLYTLRNVDLPFEDLLHKVAEAGFDGVEFANRVTAEDPDHVVDVLETTGLEAAGAHVGIEALEDDQEETLDQYARLGCENLVVPWMGPEHFGSRDSVDVTVDRLESLGEALADSGFDLHYHNHDHEYTSLDGTTGFELFLDTSTIGIELDCGLALAAGDDVAARLRSLGDRSRLVHLKDYDVEADESVPIGEGDLDLDGIAASIDENDSDWVVYEYEGDDPQDSLDMAADRTNDLC